MPEKLDVIFRADRKKEPDVTAVFPSLCGSDEYDMTCYEHVGQHGSCEQGYINRTRLAKPHEYADLLTELQRIYAPEYVLRVCKRITRRHRAKRKAEMQRMRAT